jgi:hypothetical protein
MVRTFRAQVEAIPDGDPSKFAPDGFSGDEELLDQLFVAVAYIKSTIYEPFGCMEDANRSRDFILKCIWNLEDGTGLG